MNLLSSDHYIFFSPSHKSSFFCLLFFFSLLNFSAASAETFAYTIVVNISFSTLLLLLHFDMSCEIIHFFSIFSLSLFSLSPSFFPSKTIAPEFLECLFLKKKIYAIKDFVNIVKPSVFFSGLEKYCYFLSVFC